jgi:hypothetical protein
MIRSIVPRGFEATAHPVFRTFSPPPVSMTSPSAASASVDTQIEADNAARREPGEPAAVRECGLKISKSSSSFDASLSYTEVDETNGEFICAICLEEVQEPVTLVACIHQYCYQCLYTWYKTRMNCPICKSSGRVFVYRGPGNNGGAPLRLWTLAAGDDAVTSSHHPPARATPQAGQESVAAEGDSNSAWHSAEEVKRAMLRHSETLRLLAAYSDRVRVDHQSNAGVTEDKAKGCVSSSNVDQASKGVTGVNLAVSACEEGLSSPREPKRRRLPPR